MRDRLRIRNPKSAIRISRPRTGQAKGVALIMVLWVIAILSVVVLEFSFGMRTEANMTKNFKEEAYLYGLAELAEWAKRVEQVARFSESTYVVFNNDGAGCSVINALQMQGILEANRTAPARNQAPFRLEQGAQAALFASVAA